jgi:hypothetical protein
MIRTVKAIRTDVRLLVGSLIAITIVAVVAALTAPPPPGPPLSIRSAEADGAMVLRLWLEQSGYQVRELVSARFDPKPLTCCSSSIRSPRIAVLGIVGRNWCGGHT